jgi:hypothetical protein
MVSFLEFRDTKIFHQSAHGSANIYIGTIGPFLCGGADVIVGDLLSFQVIVRD